MAPVVASHPSTAATHGIIHTAVIQLKAITEITTNGISRILMPGAHSTSATQQVMPYWLNKPGHDIWILERLALAKNGVYFLSSSLV